MNPIRKTDFWLGLLTLTGGILSFFESRTFGDASRSYPLVLSALFILLGLAISINVLRESNTKTGRLDQLFSQMLGPLLVAAMLIGWAALLMMNVGYLVSSIIVLPLVLWLLGYREIKFIAATAFGILGAVFVLFRVLFDIPLPLNALVEKLLEKLL